MFAYISQLFTGAEDDRKKEEKTNNDCNKRNKNCMLPTRVAFIV